jgi:predicted DNA binding CopG/RHH family protein
MKNNQSSVSKAETYEAIGRFWDEHDLADFWEQTEPVTFEIDLKKDVVYCPLTEDLANRLRKVAQSQGVPAHELLNTWIEEKLQGV